MQVFSLLPYLSLSLSLPISLSVSLSPRKGEYVSAAVAKKREMERVDCFKWQS